MTLYFRIFSSILLSLLALSVFSSSVIAIYVLVTDGVPLLDVLGLPFLIALMGLVVFGFTGALYWSILFKMTSQFFRTTFKAHAFSAISSIPVTMVILIAFMGGESSLEGLLKILFLFIIILLPVVLLSLFFYKMVYLKART
ncbi:MAG: hypothetical protein KBT75_12200 [Oleispira antarctica]|nr:hypothetical protein [Oleispira antarctica]MBQ0792565.1 hypothetical protein [Oleispira antarctica]